MDFRLQKSFAENKTIDFALVSHRLGIEKKY